MTMQDNHGGPLAVPREVEPFQVATLFLSLFYGVVASAWYEQVASTSIKLYPGPGGRIFLAGLVLGSLTALLGIRNKTLRGIRVERSGLLLLALWGSLYAVWTPFAIGWRGLGLILWMGLLISVPGYIVARRRGKAIDAAERALRARPEVDPDDR
jgi:hypothetical protein